MITNEVCIDWLTLTSFVMGDVYSEVRSAIIETGLFQNPVLMKRRGYSGVLGKSEKGTAFIGVGRVVDKQHYMAAITSDAAQYVMECLSMTKSMKARRIDVQLTMFNPNDIGKTTVMYMDARDMFEMGLKQTGRRPKVTMIHGGESGLHTLYVGSRSSEKYIRVYEKQGIEGSRWTRFEVEFKGQMAEDLFNRIHENKDNMTSILRACLQEVLETLPDTPLLKPHRKELSSLECLNKKKREVIPERDPNIWVEKVLLPALSKLLDSGAANTLVLSEVIIMGNTAGKLLRSYLEASNDREKGGLMFIQPSLIEVLPDID